MGVVKRHFRKFLGTGHRIYVQPVRRWMHRRGWLYSPTADMLAVGEAVVAAVKEQQARPVEIRWVQKPDLPKLPTYIGVCCREWVLAYGAAGGRCGLCGERPIYLREDTPEAEAEARAPRVRERIVVRSTPQPET
jgi:hypothetical protein